ncbi:hypothetical protein [Zooshikella harenae]|uniref:Uncharacterized protein n=1 Tax=Zooshikella harenae TaxID=2827238 RepID=A0ABS5ZGT8_9GAMM|nr:hypothetical protein [Zooshikella harenae]MBU2713180.1 hypothetical protein [Zooshikella harenae]
MHQWFVKQGRIGIVRDGNFLNLYVDPEGCDKCLLTALDAKEITEILTTLAHEIWEGQIEREEYTQQYNETESGHFQWKNSGSVITVGVSSDFSAIEIKINGNSPFKMSINQVVEFIQIVQMYLSD